jgi:hypothetical protein
MDRMALSQNFLKALSVLRISESQGAKQAQARLTLEKRLFTDLDADAFHIHNQINSIALPEVINSVDGLRLQLQKAENERDSIEQRTPYRNEMPARYLGGGVLAEARQPQNAISPAEHKHRELEHIDLIIAELRDEIGRLNARRERITPRLTAFAKRVARCEKTLAAQSRGVEFAPLITVNKVGVKELDHERKTIAKLKADRREIDASPIPREVKKARVAAQVAALVGPGHVDEMGNIYPARIDDTRVASWPPDALLKFYFDQIDAEGGDDSVALTDEARMQRIKAIDKAILEVERREEFLVGRLLVSDSK